MLGKLIDNTGRLKIGPDDVLVHGISSERHGQAFCKLRGIVSSVRKQGRKMLVSLKELIVSPAKLGELLATAKPT